MGARQEALGLSTVSGDRLGRPRHQALNLAIPGIKAEITT